MLLKKILGFSTLESIQFYVFGFSRSNGQIIIDKLCLRNSFWAKNKSCRLKEFSDLNKTDKNTYRSLEVFCLCKNQFQKNLMCALCNILGLNRTGHMSFLIRQERTPKFAGQDCRTGLNPIDRTESGLIFLNILHTKYGLSILVR